MHEQPIYVPLRDRSGQIVAHALVDQADQLLAEHRWYLDPGNAKRGGKPYVRRRIWNRGDTHCQYLHREVLGLGRDDPRKGDHVNGDTLDCRRANLRIVTAAQNAQNQDSRGGSSRYRGVTWDKSRAKWMATATLNGRRRTIGRFDSEDEAHAAAVEWRREHMPFSAEAA